MVQQIPAKSPTLWGLLVGKTTAVFPRCLLYFHFTALFAYMYIKQTPDISPTPPWPNFGQSPAHIPGEGGGAGTVLSPCQTRRRSRGVCVAFLNFLNFSRTPRELQEKMILFVKKSKPWRPHGVLMASSSRPRRSYGVLTAFCGVLCGVPWSLHDVFTVFARRSWRSHRASTAFAPRFHGVLALL